MESGHAGPNGTFIRTVVTIATSLAVLGIAGLVGFNAHVSAKMSDLSGDISRLELQLTSLTPLIEKIPKLETGLSRMELKSGMVQATIVAEQERMAKEITVLEDGLRSMRTNWSIDRGNFLSDLKGLAERQSNSNKE